MNDMISPAIGGMSPTNIKLYRFSATNPGWFVASTPKFKTYACHCRSSSHFCFSNTCLKPPAKSSLVLYSYFPIFFHIFLWFSYNLDKQNMVFLWFSIFSHGFPIIWINKTCFSYGFPYFTMVFL